MKRVDLVSHLRKNNCVLLREGGSHSIYINSTNGLISTIPRHTEINIFIGKKICRDLKISEIKKK